MVWGTCVAGKGLDHLDRLFDFGDLGDNALLASEKLPLGESVAIVLLVEKTEDGLGALPAGFLNVFLDSGGLTRKTALGTFFSSSYLPFSVSPPTLLVIIKMNQFSFIPFIQII